MQNKNTMERESIYLSTREGVRFYTGNFLLIAESLVSFKDVFARDFNPKDIRYSRGSFDLKMNRNRLNGESSLAGLLQRNRFIKNKSTSLRRHFTPY